MPPGIDIEAVRKIHRSYDAGLITKQECAEQIKSITGRVFTELEDRHESTIVKNSALLDFIRKLKKEYKIGLLSNIGNNWIVDYFLTPAEQALFDDMVFSFEAGMVKPDARIFHMACESLGVLPTEAIMVDDVERYCEAAGNLGMKTICYVDFQQFKTDLEQILYQA